MAGAEHIARLEAALERVAKLVEEDLTYAPIFERIDAELQAAYRPTPTNRARARIQQARLAA
jgi:hypothetical protein